MLCPTLMSHWITLLYYILAVTLSYCDTLDQLKQILFSFHFRLSIYSHAGMLRRRLLGMIELVKSALSIWIGGFGAEWVHELVYGVCAEYMKWLSRRWVHELLVESTLSAWIIGGVGAEYKNGWSRRRVHEYILLVESAQSAWILLVESALHEFMNLGSRGSQSTRACACLV